MGTRESNDALIELFHGDSAKVLRLGAIIAELDRGSYEPSREIGRVLWPLTEEGYALTRELAEVLSPALDPCESAQQWLEAQQVPRDVPGIPDSARRLNYDEKELFLARQHVRACAERLKCLWNLANEQAAANQPSNVHAVLRTMCEPFVHMGNHLSPDWGSWSKL